MYMNNALASRKSFTCSYKRARKTLDFLKGIPLI